MDEITKGILGVSEAAELMGVTPRTIQRWIEAGKLAGNKLGSGNKATYVLDRSDVERLMGERDA